MTFCALRNLPLLVAAGAVLAVAGCGSDDGEGSSGGQEAIERAPSPVASATVQLPGKDGDVISAVAAGEGAVWVARSGCVGSVSRIDPEGNKVAARIPVGFIVDVAVGRGAVWALGFTCPGGESPAKDPALFRIDPATNELDETIPIDVSSAGRRAEVSEHVAAGEGGVWVPLELSATSGEILRIDPRSNVVAARIPVEGAPAQIAVAGGAIWVLSHPELTNKATERRGSSLLRIDPDTNEVTATLARERLEVPGGSGMPSLLAVGADSLWVRGSGGGRTVSRTAFRVDVETNGVVRERLDTESFFPFAVVENGVWFLGRRREQGDTGQTYTIERLNSETLDVDAVVEAGRGFDAVFEPESRSFWVAKQDFRAVEKQSVVRVDPR